MNEYRVFIGARYVGTVRADSCIQAVERARVKYRPGEHARVRVTMMGAD
jgi:hypothetical protein